MINFFNNNLLSLPRKIKKEILTTSLPLFLISATRVSKNNSLYWVALIGALFGMIPISSKLKMSLSSIFFILQVFYKDLYFFSFGYALSQSYRNNILISKEKEISAFISRIEIIGWLFSELLVVPKTFQLILGSICLFISYSCDPPCVESNDPFDEMKKRIEFPSLVNAEYRLFIKGKEPSLLFAKAQPFLFEVLYLAGSNKIFILFCSFFSIEVSELFIFGILVLGVFDMTYEPLILLLKGSARNNVLFRVLSTYLSLWFISIVKNIIRKDN